jgi:hypothetical protein
MNKLSDHELKREITKRWRVYSLSKGGHLTKVEYDAYFAGFSEGYIFGQPEKAVTDEKVPLCGCGRYSCWLCFPDPRDHE